MSIRTYVKSMLLLSLIAISTGGFLLHLKIHPFAENSSNFVPFISGMLGILIVPLLFSFKKTIGYGYVLNGLLVIIGTITMAHFAIAHWPKPVTLGSLLLKTTLADIIILWGKLFVGKALFDLEVYGYDRSKIKKGSTLRYPNFGWWIIHLIAISLIYYLGNLLWR